MNTVPTTVSRSPRSRTLTASAGLAALLPLTLTACGGGVASEGAETSETTAADETVTVENCGRELSFDAAPTSVVGMMPSQTELLLRLGVPVESIVGQAQTETSALPEDISDQASDIPVLSTDMPPAREDLLATSPDFVVSPTEYEFTAEQGFASLDQLADNGAQAYVATGGCADRRNTAEVTDVLTDITNLGEIMGVPQEATALNDDAEARLTAVEDAIADQDPLSVAQVYVEGNSLGAIGAGVEADIILQAGGENVFDPGAPEFEAFFATEINPEEIIERDPEAIVFGTSGSENEEQTREYLSTTFPDTPAVENDRLIAVDQSDLYPGTLGNIDAVETIAAELYPQAF
ncbi:zinc ABC transporter substrate-binding protein [Nesterenkonia sp. AN1]|uniref:ABC transporter substrate-binding protein n=1 Tax=Nesterenkonia sp. AN1 TaxID=652017 RepID=UPI000447ABAD|nr:ABC transporter substrate-binding protein [Nesterenkonia sp. AN1]EXF23906.1 zinc ABC transporter substrate-binding protein [Nesterenkonia sp. AN1]